MSSRLLSAAAVLLIVVLGAWNVGLQLQAGDTARRADELRQAVALAAEPGARIAQLAGTDAAPGASGFAAFSADGTGAMVVRGLPPAPSDKTYQAWFLKAGGPASAGLVRVEKDGLLVVTGLRPGAVVDGMALSLEATGGATDAQGPQGPIVVAPTTA